MSSKRVAGVCAAVAAATMGLCQAASAGTVAYEAVNARSLTYAEVAFTAAPGETNDTSVTLTSETAVITDPGKTLTADPAFAADTASHCTFSGDRAVCRTDPNFPFADTVLTLGDGNDRGRVVSSAQRPSPIFPFCCSPLQNAALYGGPGNDTLVGSVGDDFLVGGTGADDLRGGLGRDWASYTRDGDQTTGVNVTIDDVANDGHPGEHDNVHTDVEDVDGTLDGNNVLTGSNADNALFGNHGSDVLRGGAGNDELWGGFEPGTDGSNTLDGGTGLDTLIGGGGPDTIKARDSLPDLRITCRGGTDVVNADSSDPADADCETVNRG